ncbi:MAG: hypothetical protein CV087_22860 [Candidatus Brocadia sp. WS118]|nr:MAG: hypothetical protein CV087_22860 [Candidatus Brocadia sp. WS118]
MAPVQKALVNSYADVARQAETVHELYTKYKLTISNDLATLCKSAHDLSEKWEAKKTYELSPNVLWEALALNRVANALLALDGHSRAHELLKKLSDGRISMLKHVRSFARDTFWEVEVWNYIKRAGLNADLIDPPDIIWTADARETGIACKRVYSEKNIEKILSEAIKQIEATPGFGIAAFQLEDVRIPEGKFLSKITQAEAAEVLQEINLEFLKEHERHFLKYFSKDRLTAALAATSCIVLVEDIQNVATEWSVWTHPDLSVEHKARVTQLYEAISKSSSD